MRRVLATICLVMASAVWSCRTSPPPVPADDPKADEPKAGEADDDAADEQDAPARGDDADSR